MKKISQIVIVLLCGICFNGCLLFVSLSEKSKQTKAQKEVDCANFEGANLAKLQKDMKTYESYKRKIKILDESKGKLSNNFSKEFYCNVLEVTSTTSETKSFAVNGSGSNDFNVKITKELYNAQKTKEGEVLEKDIKISAYSLEKVSGVYYDGYIYKPDSPYIKKIRDKYAKIKENLEKTFRDNLPCFEMNRKKYCDGDLVTIWGGNGQAMLRVVESGYGTVRYELYYYNGVPITKADYSVMEQFKMNPPEVIGNHDLKAQLEDGRAPLEYTLRLSDIKTFKEW